MGITSKAKFSLYEVEDNACALLISNRIEIGIKCFTIETLIHEINEIEVTDIIEKIGEMSKRMVCTKMNMRKYIYKYIPHYIAPHGQKSLIYPLKDISNEECLI